MGAHRDAWVENFNAEFAANVQADHLQALIDLIKCFETVPHEQLIVAARARGVPHGPPASIPGCLQVM